MKKNFFIYLLVLSICLTSFISICIPNIAYAGTVGPLSIYLLDHYTAVLTFISSTLGVFPTNTDAVDGLVCFVSDKIDGDTVSSEVVDYIDTIDSGGVVSTADFSDDLINALGDAGSSLQTSDDTDSSIFYDKVSGYGNFSAWESCPVSDFPIVAWWDNGYLYNPGSKSFTVHALDGSTITFKDTCRSGTGEYTCVITSSTLGELYSGMFNTGSSGAKPAPSSKPLIHFSPDGFRLYNPTTAMGQSIGGINGIDFDIPLTGSVSAGIFPLSQPYAESGYELLPTDIVSNDYHFEFNDVTGLWDRIGGSADSSIQLPLVDEALPTVEYFVVEDNDNASERMNDIIASLTALTESNEENSAITNGFLSGISDSINDFFDNFGSKITDALTDAFVPTDGYFESKFNDIKVGFESKLNVDDYINELSFLNDTDSIADDDNEPFVFEFTIFDIPVLLDISVVKTISPYTRAIFSLLAGLTCFLFVLHNILVLVRGSSMARFEGFNPPTEPSPYDGHDYF